MSHDPVRAAKAGGAVHLAQFERFVKSMVCLPDTSKDGADV